MSKRILITSLILSAAAFVGVVRQEGYTEDAKVPVKGDVPTYGFGTTIKQNGQPVKLGDRTTPVKAVEDAYAHLSKDEKLFKASLPNVLLSQGEYDTYLDFTYQYGMATWNKSSMRREILNGNYRAACDALLKYRYVAGRDCSIKSSNCMGVWTRQKERHVKCIGADG
nr:lysozyme [Alkanindiges illinoisensis]